MKPPTAKEIAQKVKEEKEIEEETLNIEKGIKEYNKQSNNAGKSFLKLPEVRSIILNGEKNCGRKTVILAGLPRSGTSMTSSVIDALGIPMETYKKDFQRNAFLGDMNNKNVYKNILIQITKLNKAYDNWGTKTSPQKRYIDMLATRVINPFVIIVMRDPVALAERYLTGEIPTHKTIHAMDYTLRRTQELWECAKKLNYPVLLVSNERLKYNSVRGIDEIGKFLNINITQKQKKEALSRISKVGGYLFQ